MATYNWALPTDGDWTSAGGWTPSGGPPGAADTAIIGAVGAYTVDISASDNIVANTVSLDAAGAALQVDGQLSASEVVAISGTIVLSTGTITDSAFVINLSTIDAGASGDQSEIAGVAFGNGGAVNVTNGATFAIATGQFINAGQIFIDSNSELDLVGAVGGDASQGAGYVGTVDIEGVMNAHGNTIDLGATSAFADTTLGGTLENAVIVSDMGTIDYTGGTLSATTVDGTLDLGDSGLLTIVNGLTVNGDSGTGAGVINVTGSAAALSFGDTETLDNVTLNVGSSTGFDMAVANGASLTLGAGVVVNSIGLNGLNLGGSGVVISEGTINTGVAGGIAQLASDSFINAGTLNVTGGETVEVSAGTFGNTGYVTIDAASELYLYGGASIAATQASGGAVDIEGTLDANGNTIDLGSTSAFANTTLGGTLDSAVILSDGGTIDYTGGTLSAATVYGVLDLGDSGLLTIINGLTVYDAAGTGPGVINVTGSAAALGFGDTETLDNVTLNIGSSTGFDMAVANGASLVLGPNAVINSIGLNGLQLGGSGVVVNEGAINTGVAGGVVQLASGGFVNAGALNVTGGETVEVSVGTFGNTGYVTIDSASELYLFGGVSIAAAQASGGTVDIEGALDANGNTIDLGSTSAFADTTLGGTLDSAVIVSDGGTISYDLGTLVNATVDGVLDLGDSGLLIIAGGLTVNNAAGTGPGVIDVTGSAAALIFSDSETLDNVTLNVGSSTGFDEVNGNGAALTLGAHAVVNSLGLNGLQLGGVAAVTNLGRINAGVAGGSASIDTGSFLNAGTITISQHQFASLTSEDGAVVNTGSIVVTACGTLDITSGLSGGGRVTVTTNSTLELGGAVAASQRITLQGNIITVALDEPMLMAATLVGMATGDRIDLVDYNPLDKVTTVGQTAVITNAGAATTLHFAGVLPTQAFGLVYDGNGGADLILGKVINGAAGGHATLVASGNAIITAHGYGNTITALADDSVINAGNGGAHVTVGNIAANVLIAGYNNVVSAGNGNELVTGSASHSTVSLGYGNDLVTLNGSYDAVSAKTGDDLISITGNYDSATVGAGSNTISVSGSLDTVRIGGGSATVTVTGSHDAVFIGGSSAAITDHTSRLDVVAGPFAANSVLYGVASDPHFVLDLIGGVGGYHTAAQVVSALAADGSGGSLLALGGYSIDFAGVAPTQLSAHNFNVVHTYAFS